MCLQKDVNLFPAKMTSARGKLVSVPFAKMKTIAINPAVLLLPWILGFKPELVFRKVFIENRTGRARDLVCLEGCVGEHSVYH